MCILYLIHPVFQGQLQYFLFNYLKDWTPLWIMFLNICGLKVQSWDGRKDHPETAPPGDPSDIQPPNLDTIAYASKVLLTGPWYSYLLWSIASSWKIQKRMLIVIYWMEHRAPNEGAWESTQGAEGVRNPIGGTTIWTNQYHPELCL